MKMTTKMKLPKIITPNILISKNVSQKFHANVSSRTTSWEAFRETTMKTVSAEYEDWSIFTFEMKGGKIGWVEVALINSKFESVLFWDLSLYSFNLE